MNFELNCRCGQRFVVDEARAGSLAKCRCGATVHIPSISKLSETAPVVADVIGPPRPKANLQSSACPYCGHAMQAGAVIGDRYKLKWLPADKSLTLGIWAAEGEPIGEKQLLSR